MSHLVFSYILHPKSYITSYTIPVKHCTCIQQEITGGFIIVIIIFFILMHHQKKTLDTTLPMMHQEVLNYTLPVCHVPTP